MKTTLIVIGTAIIATSAGFILGLMASDIIGEADHEDRIVASESKFRNAWCDVGELRL